MVVVALLALIVLMVPAGLIFWAMYRSTSITERLHPLTPEQRRAKRRVYAVMIPVMAATLALAAAVGRAGITVVISIFAAVVLLDAILTPLLHYRRSKHRAGSP
jgi:hypothetical protein